MTRREHVESWLITAGLAALLSGLAWSGSILINDLTASRADADRRAEERTGPLKEQIDAAGAAIQATDTMITRMRQRIRTMNVFTRSVSGRRTLQLADSMSDVVYRDSVRLSTIEAYELPRSIQFLVRNFSNLLGEERKAWKDRRNPLGHAAQVNALLEADTRIAAIVLHDNDARVRRLEIVYGYLIEEDRRDERQFFAALVVFVFSLIGVERALTYTRTGRLFESKASKPSPTQSA